MSEWISVENGLPPLGDYSVLAYCKHGGMDMIHVEEYFKVIGNGADADGEQLYTKRYLLAGVLHWMPLPEPPPPYLIRSNDETPSRRTDAAIRTRCHDYK